MCNFYYSNNVQNKINMPWILFHFYLFAHVGEKWLWFGFTALTLWNLLWDRWSDSTDLLDLINQEHFNTKCIFRQIKNYEHVNLFPLLSLHKRRENPVTHLLIKQCLKTSLPIRISFNAVDACGKKLFPGFVLTNLCSWGEQLWGGDTWISLQWCRWFITLTSSRDLWGGRCCDVCGDPPHPPAVMMTLYSLFHRVARRGRGYIFAKGK